MSIPVIKAITRRIRLRMGSTANAATAAGVSPGVFSHYENDDHPDTTMPLHRFVMVANAEERRALIDLLTAEDHDRPTCAMTEAAKTTEAGADLQRCVREALQDGKVTEIERRAITRKAMEVKAEADDVIQAVAQ